LLEPHEEPLMQRAQVPGGMADPIGQRMNAPPIQPFQRGG
jgi:hypothetical protein